MRCGFVSAPKKADHFKKSTLATVGQNHPIGVFDSGMGGLSILKALRSALPKESFIYLGDSARLPYGTKSKQTVIAYAKQASEILMARDIKALVVACNTASGHALDELSEILAPRPVIGVVKAGSRAAVKVADKSGILVLATESTVRGGAYEREILSLSPKTKVYGRACPLWVALAEEGHSMPIASLQELAVPVVRHGIRGFSKTPNTVLLGCTHFPVISSYLAAQLPEGTRIVEAGETVASELYVVLKNNALLNNDSDKSPVVRYIATDNMSRFLSVGQFFLGEKIDHVELVQIGGAGGRQD